MSLEGKVCIVTGASSGFGEAIAVLFAERKAHVVLCGRSETRLNEALKRCQEVSGSTEKLLCVTGDLTEAAVRENILQKAVEKFGRIDVLVLNAGIIFKPCPITDVSEERFDNVVDMNMKSVFFMIKSAVPHLEKTKGNVVCISSLASHVAAQAALYCMSKAGIDHLCRCLALSLGPQGIRVNTVNPSFSKTRLMRSVFPALESDDYSDVDAFYEMKAAVHPLEGRLVTPEEVARATAYLASDEASFVTGQTLDVDGGASLTSKVF